MASKPASSSIRAGWAASFTAWGDWPGWPQGPFRTVGFMLFGNKTGSWLKQGTSKHQVLWVWGQGWRRNDGWSPSGNAISGLWHHTGHACSPDVTHGSSILPESAIRKVRCVLETDPSSADSRCSETVIWMCLKSKNETESLSNTAY